MYDRWTYFSSSSYSINNGIWVGGVMREFLTGMWLGLAGIAAAVTGDQLALVCLAIFG
jgi:hypothetical protein